MVVNEEFEVLAHDKHMKKPLMDELEAFDGLVLPWIAHGEAEFDYLARSEQVWRDGKVQVVFDRIRESGDEFHAAARANPGLAGAHVGMHRQTYTVSFAQAIAARKKSRMRTSARMGPSSHKIWIGPNVGSSGASSTGLEGGCHMTRPLLLPTFAFC